MVIFETIEHSLLITHLFTVFFAIILISLTWVYLFVSIRGKTIKKGLKKLTLYSLISYVATFIIGGLLYPAFRYYIRALYLDVELPLGTGLFEIKEHLSSLGIIILLVSTLVVYNSDYKKERKKLLFQFGLFTLLLIIIMFKIAVGFYLAGERPL